MNNHVSYAVLTVVLLADIPAANAQDVIVESPPGAVVTRPASTVDTVPVETVETVKTVRSVGHGVRRPISHHLARSRPETIVTTTTRRTILRERIVTAPAALARAVAEPAYTDVVEAPPAYSSPLQPYWSPL